MAFYGCDFSFDNINASSKGLMLYDFGSYTQEDVDFSVGEIIEDRINRRYDSLLYGLVQNEPLEFTLVFGANPDLIDAGTYLTREKINEIVKWLTGHQTWKHLTIDQDDMMAHVGQDEIPRYYYKCMITGLKLITDGMYPWAFSCRVTCDSPFAYIGTYYTGRQINGQTEVITFENTSGVNGYLYPVITVSGNTGSVFSVVNTTDHNRACSLSGMPTESQNITIDCANCIITSSAGYNLYPYFNKKFLRLVPGTNSLSVFGTGLFMISCEIPVNIGA